MTGYNPLIDAGVIAGLMVIVLIACYFGSKQDAKKKAALRGATRIAQ